MRARSDKQANLTRDRSISSTTQLACIAKLLKLKRQPNQLCPLKSILNIELKYKSSSDFLTWLIKNMSTPISLSLHQCDQIWSILLNSWWQIFILKYVDFWALLNTSIFMSTIWATLISASGHTGFNSLSNFEMIGSIHSWWWWWAAVLALHILEDSTEIRTCDDMAVDLEVIGIFYVGKYLEL